MFMAAFDAQYADSPGKPLYEAMLEIPASCPDRRWIICGKTASKA
jgi:hypothetical protein